MELVVVFVYFGGRSELSLDFNLVRLFDRCFVGGGGAMPNHFARWEVQFGFALLHVPIENHIID